MVRTTGILESTLWADKGVDYYSHNLSSAAVKVLIYIYEEINFQLFA